MHPRIGKGIKLKLSENIEGDIELKNTMCSPVVNGRSSNISETTKISKLKTSGNRIEKWHACNISEMGKGIKLKISQLRRDVELNQNTIMCIQVVKSPNAQYLRVDRIMVFS